MDINKTIEERKIVPVVALPEEKDALPLAEALIAGGLPIAEVTFRTAAAENSIREITKRYPEMLVGAGTVATAEQAKKAQDAGAKFLVSAGFSREVTEYAIKNQLPIFPGVCTPTELMMLLEYDLHIAKFFPASQYGGLDTIKALSGPFPNMRFMPTGGISSKNIREYLAYPKVIACGGSWMVKGDLIKAGDFEEIRKLTAEAVALVRA